MTACGEWSRRFGRRYSGWIAAGSKPCSRSTTVTAPMASTAAMAMRRSSSATGRRCWTRAGAVRLGRAWYHCSGCGSGFAPRDRELGVAGASLSPGLLRMVARVGSHEPFAQAARDLAELAGVDLATKRVERSAEATGSGGEGGGRAGGGRDHRRDGGGDKPGGWGRQALCRAGRHRHTGGAEGDAWSSRQRRRRAAPNPRGQARLRIHPDQGRRARPAGARPRLIELCRRPGIGRTFRLAGLRGSVPARS